MSILVRGMEMPKSCWDRPVSYYVHVTEVLHCGLAKKDVDESQSIDKNCPLISVPTPHGDLIDRDALKQNITANLPVAFQGFSVGLCNIVDMQKTIIEGEAD